jgi:hypothetical protein
MKRSQERRKYFKLIELLGGMINHNCKLVLYRVNKAKNRKGINMRKAFGIFLLELLIIGIVTQGSILLAGESNENPHHGIFAILRSKETNDYLEKLVKLDTLDGITFYIGLTILAPEKGKYDWSLIDKVVDACKEHHKKINLAIIAGRWIPEWIYKDGADKFSWTLHQHNVNAGKSYASAPIPWDTVYLKALKDVVAAIGKRYDNCPEIVTVQVTGPSLTNGLEANLNITKEQAKEIGYTQEKYINAWKEMFQAFSTAFPQKQLAWCIHDMFPEKRDPYPGRTIRDWAFKKYGKRFSLMCCYLPAESWFARGNQAVDIWAEDDRIHRGAQLIDLYSAKKKAPENIYKALENGAALNCSFYEIFAGDCITPEYYKEIVKFKKHYMIKRTHKQQTQREQENEKQAYSPGMDF